MSTPPTEPAARGLSERLVAAEAELSSTREALAFANESVEKMREQIKRGIGVCWHDTCRQPALVLLDGWPLCGEHGDERARGEAAEHYAAGRRDGAVEAWDAACLAHYAEGHGSEFDGKHCPDNPHRQEADRG